MEISTLRNFAHLGMDQGFMHQWQQPSYIDELNDVSMATAAFCDNYNYDDMQQLCSRPMFNEANLSENESIIIRPFKLQKTNSWDCDELSKMKEEIDFSSSVSFSTKKNLPSLDSPTSVSNQNYVFNSFPGSGSGNGNKQAIRTKTKMGANNNNDHVIAERKRREKLNQRFIALSALVPGLKKMDKATVLGDTIKYLKQLQEKVNNLQDQTRKQLVFLKKHQLLANDSSSDSDIQGKLSNDDVTKSLPEIEVRYSGKDVLVRIHCQKRKRILDKIVAQIERFPLSIINSSVMTFGTSILDITIIAQMEDGFTMQIKDFMKNMSSTLQNLMGNEHCSIQQAKP